MEIQKRYLTNNDCYKGAKKFKPVGIMIHSVGTPQPDANVFIKAWDKTRIEVAPHAIVDALGIFQTLPWNVRGWHAGGKANDTHIGIEICEPGNFTYGRGSNMIGYDVVKNTEFFNRIWKNTVELCAKLCTTYGIEPQEIICHSEGFTKGIATNHADIMHWFPRHGKNMDMFRADVKDRMENGTLDNKPDTYAKEQVIWAQETEILLGDTSGNLKLHSPVTRQDLMVFMKRMYDLMNK